MRKALDWAWRLPLVILIRAPLMLVGMALENIGQRMQTAGTYVPALPYFGKRS